MELILIILRNTVHTLIFALEIAMFIRAIISWFPIDENKFTDFLYSVTEPVIMPIRLLFEKLGWFQNLPIDISFFVTFILLSLLSNIL